MNDEVSEKIVETFNRRDHLANERTFLAWIRTSIGIMAFGFVIERFSFFLNEMNKFVSSTDLKETVVKSPSYNQGYSTIMGIVLIAFGAFFSAFAFMRFKEVEKQIYQGRYQPPYWLTVGVTTLVFLVGITIVIYLIRNVIIGALPI